MPGAKKKTVSLYKYILALPLTQRTWLKSMIFATRSFLTDLFSFVFVRLATYKSPQKKSVFFVSFFFYIFSLKVGGGGGIVATQPHIGRRGQANMHGKRFQFQSSDWSFQYYRRQEFIFGETVVAFPYGGGNDMKKKFLTGDINISKIKRWYKFVLNKFGFNFHVEFCESTFIKRGDG